MCCSVAGCSSSPGGRCITMIEDGHNFGLMLALRHLLGRLESKGMMSYPESQRMLDQALADVKRLRIEDKLTHEAAADASNSSANSIIATEPRPTPPTAIGQSSRASAAPAARSAGAPMSLMARRLERPTPSVVVSP